MEQHDPLGQRHRARRPRHHGAVAPRAEQVEQPQPVQQHADVAAGDEQARDAAELRFDRAALGLHRGALRGPHPLLELPVHVGDPGCVLAVEPAHQLPGVFELRRRERIGARLLEQLLHRLHQAGEPQPVELLDPAQRRVARAHRLEQVRVGLEHALDARPDLEVLDRTADVLPQLVVLVLALLPARGDQRDRLVTTADEVVDRRPQDRVAALRAQHGRSRELHAHMPTRAPSALEGQRRLGAPRPGPNYARRPNPSAEAACRAAPGRRRRRASSAARRAA